MNIAAASLLVLLGSVLTMGAVDVEDDSHPTMTFHMIEDTPEPVIDEGSRELVIKNTDIFISRRFRYSKPLNKGTLKDMLKSDAGVQKIIKQLGVKKNSRADVVVGRAQGQVSLELNHELYETDTTQLKPKAGGIPRRLLVNGLEKEVVNLRQALYDDPNNPGVRVVLDDKGVISRVIRLGRKSGRKAAELVVLNDEDCRGVALDVGQKCMMDTSSDDWDDEKFSSLLSVDDTQDNMVKLIQEESYDVTVNEPGNQRRNLRSSGTAPISTPSEPSQHRSLQAGCGSFEIIDVVVAADSYMCEKYGGVDNTAARVQTILGLVSDYYEDMGLCKKLNLAALDLHCNAATDPFRAMIDEVYSPTTNTTVHACDLLTKHFRHHVKASSDQQDSVYNEGDIVHLFYGTADDAGQIAGNVGCAYQAGLQLSSGLCAGEGLNTATNLVTPTNLASLASVLVAHEAGHNLGSQHVDDTKDIMYAVLQSSTQQFGDDSKSQINTVVDHKKNQGICNLAVEQVVPTQAPTSSPAQPSVPVPAPACADIAQSPFIPVTWSNNEKTLEGCDFVSNYGYCGTPAYGNQCRASCGCQACLDESDNFFKVNRVSHSCSFLVGSDQATRNSFCSSYD